MKFESERDRKFHLDNVKIRLFRSDGHHCDVDRSYFGIKGQDFPPILYLPKAPTSLKDAADSIPFERTSVDPTVYVQIAF